MTTRAKLTFDVNVQRASYFLDIHQAVQPGVGAPVAPHRELPRGAVVFAIGALDAYLAEVSAEVITRDLQAAPASTDVRELLRRIQSELPTLALEVALGANRAERMQRIQEAIVDHFQNRVSVHGSKGVAATASRVGARSADIWAALGGRGYANAAADLNRWTDIRHQIVHQGRRPGVRRNQARACIDLVSAIAAVVDATVTEE